MRSFRMFLSFIQTGGHNKSILTPSTGPEKGEVKAHMFVGRNKLQEIIFNIKGTTHIKAGQIDIFIAFYKKFLKGFLEDKAKYFCSK